MFDAIYSYDVAHCLPPRWLMLRSGLSFGGLRSGVGDGSLLNTIKWFIAHFPTAFRAFCFGNPLAVSPAELILFSSFLADDC